MKVTVKGKEYELENLIIRGISTDEQEIVVNAARDEDFFTVYTSDNTYLTKFKRIMSANPKEWKIVDVMESRGEVVGVKFKAPKKLLSFRTMTVESKMTDEQKAAASERMKNIVRKKNNN